jgi:hypothetical protein
LRTFFHQQTPIAACGEFEECKCVYVRDTDFGKRLEKRIEIR